ncbi:MAG: hypothetical protein ACU0A2_03165 [Cognatishimia sp.]|uniref:hypothetical protein n=1 Tax=Cognatishimia sp. TaxID=2211648 RepID=UPI0040580B8F
MSWDLIVFSAETPMNCDDDGVATFADNWEALSIGGLPEVQQSISTALTGVDWSDPTWGLLVGESYALEFSLGSVEQTNTFGIHARGEATAAVMQLIGATGWKILDVSTTKWLNLSTDPDEGRRQYQDYLDIVIERHYKPKKAGFFARIFGR